MKVQTSAECTEEQNKNFLANDKKFETPSFSRYLKSWVFQKLNSLCGPRNKSPKKSYLETSKAMTLFHIRLIHLFGKVLSRYCRTFRGKCAEAPSLWNNIRRRIQARLQTLQTTLLREISSDNSYTSHVKRDSNR